MTHETSRSTPQFNEGQYGTTQYSTGDVSYSGGLPFIGHQINITSFPRYVGPVSRKSAWNQFDEHGLLASLRRLPEENNWQFKRRVLDTFVHLANASYQGLIHGITRDLGLSLYQPITINPKRSLVTDRFFAPDPYIKFDGVWVWFYTDYANGVVDFKIDRFEKGGNYEYIWRFYDFINSTTFWEAHLEDWVTHEMRTMELLNQSNRISVLREAIPATSKFRLKHSRIISGSTSFYDAAAYLQEVSSETNVTSTGKYYTDYLQGIIRSYDIPEVGSSIRYQYTAFPFRPIASSVILHDINNENFKIKMFEQVETELGTVHGIPTLLGREIVNELMSVTPMYWGV
jgi:hypothetical protein